MSYPWPSFDTLKPGVPSCDNIYIGTRHLDASCLMVAGACGILACGMTLFPNVTFRYACQHAQPFLLQVCTCGGMWLSYDELPGILPGAYAVPAI